MHELAGCRLLSAEGVIDGYVVEYAAGVLRMQLDAPVLEHDVGEPVTVQVLDPVRGECTYRGLLAKALGPTVDVVVVESSGQRQRRSAARAAYQVTCLAVIDPDHEETVEQIAVTVLDVSATGLRFSSRRELPDGSAILVWLPSDQGALDLRAHVLRVEEGHGVWRYGAALVDVDEPTQERLYRLVMRLQREEVRRRAEQG